METRKYDRISAIARQRGFIWPSSELYGGIAGFFDYGHVGSLLKHNIENAWRRVFIVEEGMQEIETPNIMPDKVFEASGHLEHFKDMMATCAKCKTSFKAEELVETFPKSMEGWKKAMDKTKCPKCKGALGVFGFNLMFSTEVGPGEEKRKSYLRPETAQGMFVAFPRLYTVARKNLPFGACQIGRAYRNEISPRQGMIRLREFTQAEAEVFYDPNNKTHPGFSKVKNYKLPLLSVEAQKKGGKVAEITAGDAVKKKVMASELQAYYLAISTKFFEDIGIPKKAIRCRQHFEAERAHYSIDTWDVEIHSEDFGWIEVAAIADRTDYDLKGHAKVSKEDLSVLVDDNKVVPNVMESSFGIDRPFYCVLEHSLREEGKRTYFAFRKEIASVKAGVFPLVGKDGLPEKAREVYALLVKKNVMAQYDEKGSIGKRYARADEIGVPICITIDYDTLKDNTVTIRERDTTKQKRVKIDKIII